MSTKQEPSAGEREELIVALREDADRQRLAAITLDTDLTSEVQCPMAARCEQAADMLAADAQEIAELKQHQQLSADLAARWGVPQVAVPQGCPLCSHEQSDTVVHCGNCGPELERSARAWDALEAANA